MMEPSERAGDAENPYRSPGTAQDPISREPRRTHPVTAALAVGLVMGLLWPAVADSDWSAIRNFDVASYAISAGVIVVIFAVAVGVTWWRSRP